MKNLKANVILFILFLPQFLFCQRLESPLGHGKFIQMKFAGATFLDDSHEYGRGNLFVKLSSNANLDNLCQAFFRSDTVFEIAASHFDPSICVNESNTSAEDQVVSALWNQKLLRKLNRLNLSSSKIEAIECREVELDLPVVRIDRGAFAFLNHELKSKRDPLFVFRTITIVSLDCNFKGEF